MPGREGEPPSPQELKLLREKALNKVGDIGKDSFSAEDILKLSKSDEYVTRFWLHVFDLPGDQLDEACNMIIETFRWRKEFGVDGVSEDMINQSFFDKGVVFSHNRDKDGKKLLVFTVGRHVKGSDKMEDMKKFFVYYLERLEREENGDEITIVFDCRNSGLKNMDMEFIQFIIGVFKDYYPQMLNYILVFEMPWVLNAAWKIIKAWLPAAAVKKIKFLTKSNMGEYIDDNNRLEMWGGSDGWEYTFEPEEIKETMPEVGLVNGNSNMDSLDESKLNSEDAMRKKTVTFAEVRQSQSTDSFSSYSSSTGPDILKLNPSQEVVFSTTSSGELLARVQVTNVVEKKNVGFKIKTTSPDKYRVRPSSGILLPGQSVNVELHVSGQTAPVSLVRDKFLVTVIYLEEADANNTRLQELLKTTKPEAQYRLRCQMMNDSQGAPATRANAQNLSSTNQPTDESKQLANLLKKVNQLSEKNDELQGQLSNNFRIQLLLLALTFCLLFLVYFYLPTSNIQCSLPIPGPVEPTGSLQQEL